METPNPYESPHEVDEPADAGDDSFLERYLLRLAGG
jgi:hypothetical protein